MVDTPQFPPGSVVLDRYLVAKRLATGGMGEIYLCRQRSLGGYDRPVILKTILPELTDDTSVLNQFLDEARVVTTLNHPSVVSIIEVAEWQGGYVIAMEYIQGVDLALLMRETLRLGVLVPPRVSAGVMREAALALDYAHRATDSLAQPLNIIHRDISPQNVMVRPDGVVKIVDFGIAAAEGRLSRTEGDAIKGKLRYVAPEQLRRDTLDGRCDQWSLGIVFWELCVGQAAVEGSPFEMAQQIAEGRFRPPSALVPEFPEALDAVIMRMLKPDRGDRYPTCGAAAAALDQYLSETGGPATTEVGQYVTQVAGKTLAERLAEVTSAPKSPSGTPEASPRRPARAKSPRREVPGLSAFFGAADPPAGTDPPPESPPEAPPAVPAPSPAPPSVSEAPNPFLVPPQPPAPPPEPPNLDFPSPATDPSARPLRRPGDRAPSPGRTGSRVVGTPPARDGLPTTWVAAGAGVVVVLAAGLGMALCGRPRATPRPLAASAADTPDATRPAAPLDPDVLLRDAREALDEADFMRAQENYRKVLGLGGPTAGEAAAGLGRLQDERNAHDRMQEALELRQLDLAQAYQALLRVPPSTRAGVKAVAAAEAMRPTMVGRLLTEARDALQDRNLEEAGRKVRAVLDVDPRNEQAAKLLASIKKQESAAAKRRPPRAKR
jgi:serine/threonine-protein kinase